MKGSDNDWFFIIDSDIQHGRILDRDQPKIRKEKKNIVDKIVDINEKYDIDFVVCSGNLTERGNMKELDQFCFEYIDQLESMHEIPLKLCIGNRDIKTKFVMFKKFNPVLKYICDRHECTYNRIFRFKSGCYKFVHKGITFLCLGVYPRNIKWLIKNLPKDTHKPIIIFYHYNTLESEIYSDLWTNREKILFYNAIKSHNIKLIINGHLEISKICKWKNIPVINASGKKLGLIHIKKIDKNKDIIVDIRLI